MQNRENSVPQADNRQGKLVWRKPTLTRFDIGETESGPSPDSETQISGPNVS